MKETILQRKTLYNPQTTETPFKEKLVHGTPSGMLDFNRSRYQWAVNIYEQMEANTWFAQEVNTTDDAKSYKTLTPEEKRMYDLVFSQLSFNDALQADNLADNINAFVTNKIVGACLIRQAWEEVNHSKSYAVLIQDVTGNSEAVFDLYKDDLQLNAKNQAIADIYASLAGEVTKEKLVLAMVANQCLEGIYFIAGFTAIYALGQKMRGSADMIAFINRDENVHLRLFQNMILTMKKESPELFTSAFKQQMRNMILRAYEIERQWFRYITKDNILGFTHKLIDEYLQWLINGRLKAIDEPIEFDVGDKTPYLGTVQNKYGTFNDVRTNFFEGNVKNYSKGTLDFDNF